MASFNYGETLNVSKLLALASAGETKLQALASAGVDRFPVSAGLGEDMFLASAGVGRTNLQASGRNLEFSTSASSDRMVAFMQMFMQQMDKERDK